MTLRILHISDLHFRSLDNDPVKSFNADMVTKSMIAAIEKLIKEGSTFDFVVTTGDIAFSGKKADYEVADKFFDDLREVTGLSNSRFFIVPGNHDVDRTQVKNLDKTTWYRFTNQDMITEILTDDRLFPILMKKFTDYSVFANVVSGNRLFTDKNYYFVKKITIRKDGKAFTINLLGLNSALFAGYDKDDEQTLALGLHQVNNAINQVDENSLFTFAFFHHPFSCFHPEEADTINRITHKADIIFHGHLHKPANSAVHDAAGKVVIVGAGASFEKRESENSFNIVELDPETGQGNVVFYKYLHQHHCWNKNFDVNPHGKDGEFEFRLDVNDADVKIKTVAEAIFEPEEEDIHHYLDWVHDKCGFIDIRGLSVGSGKAHRFPISELYIPLFTSNTGKNENRYFSDAISNDFTKQILLSDALKSQYITIIGNPGSGKTTFIRYIAFLLARALREEKPGVMTELPGLRHIFFPVFIRVGELTQFIIHCKETQKECLASETDPRWVVLFLKDKNKELNWGLSDTFFEHKLKTGTCLLLLDGLDEAPDRSRREKMSTLVTNLIQANKTCRLIVTSRPQAYEGLSVLANFCEYTILPLDDDGIRTFLEHWTKVLFSGHLTTLSEQAHYNELSGALQSSPAIRRMAANPMMLTALAVIHWNQKRLPEQRDKLYESIILWLLRSREDKPGRLTAEQTMPVLCQLAFAMHTGPDGRQVQLGKKTACEVLADLFAAPSLTQKLVLAQDFLAGEEIDSGVIVERDNSVAFWHLTFQEYLCAKALGGKSDNEQKQIILNQNVLFRPEWKEVLLLFCGVLYDQGLDKIDGFFKALLQWKEGKKDLTAKARLFGLLGAMERDLSPYKYKITDPLFTQLKDDVMAIFDKNKAKHIPLAVRCEAADGLGQAGDPRVVGDNFVTIPACTFLMGAQNKDPKAKNYDKDADDSESPVHKVTLSEYKIGKYPVTVGEYARFMEDGGYKNREYWKAGRFGEVTAPGNWETQVQFPTRPVVEVSWFEAMAYAVWLGPGYSMPTEAQWERAARGPEEIYRTYPWGDDTPDGETANWSKSGLKHPSPVGLFLLDRTKEGVYDMAGNITEWCLDWKDVSYDERSSFYEKSEGCLDPLNDEKGKWGKVGETEWRVLRGGSWVDYVVGVLRSCGRGSVRPHVRNSGVGFRVVCFATELHPLRIR